jgi:hypothetical protein
MVLNGTAIVTLLVLDAEFKTADARVKLKRLYPQFE